MSESKNVMLISPDEVKAQSDLNLNVDDTVMGASIRVSQEVYLRDIIGTAFLNKLKDLVWGSICGSGDTINNEKNIAYKTLLDDYIDPVLSYKVASEICDRLSFQIRNMGVVRNSDTNVNAADLGQVTYLKQVYDTYFNDAVNRMVEFICSNKEAYAESDFPCGCGRNPKYARTGLWLG